MCDPITIAGVALAGASTVANTIAANKVRKARDDALAAERIRQNQLDQEAEALNLQSQNRYQDFEGQQEDRTGELADFFNSERAQAADANQQAAMDFLPTSGSDITVREEAARRSDATDFSNQQGEALARLRSFGDLLGEIGRGNARDFSQIGQIGGFKRASSGILPLELEDANNAGAGLNMLGDVLNLGSGVALNKGLSGGKADPWAGMRSVGSKANSGGLVRLFGG